MEDPNNMLRDFLSKLLVGDLLSSKRISNAAAGRNFRLITIQDNATIAKVLETLDENRISSAPILKTDSGKILGIVDILDLVTYCTAKLPHPVISESIAHHEVDSFLKKRAIDAMEMSARNFWHETSEKVPMLELFRLLSHPNVHRAAVLNEQKQISSLITQSDCIQFLHSIKDKLGTIISVPISSWLALKSVESIEAGQTLSEALRQMWESEVSGVAVINEQGVFIGEISAGDLKQSAGTSDMLLRLYLPVGEILSLSQNASEVPSVRMTDNLGAILDLAVSNHLHRVFVVNDAGQPISVVSNSDIISLFAPT
eukprot:TRINITY_DN10422_c0_g1_i2.p1 TRINITY_DN10422_c0_g1~~TRINITY_DN10422_c0_g1_i2.p1  ORF type:complete len:314 (+),score=45.20 TRINITY_DN10422_c0_g1_i2:114-1055(+)